MKPGAGSSTLKVLMLAAECAPFAKTGGLADVVGSLPAALRTRGIDVRVMLPLYKGVPEPFRSNLVHREFTYCSVGWRWQYVGLSELDHNGTPVYFIDNQYYFNRDALYGYDDEAERFAYLCRAALEILPHLGFQPDIIHCHDWHTGMVCALLAAQYRFLPFYRNIKTVFTIHNLAYQGRFARTVLDDLFGLGDEYYTPDRLEFYGSVSYLKAGVAYADRVTTVSTTYAQEIQTPEYGEGMDGLLRYRTQDFCGIINGIDHAVYDPAVDALLYAPYSTADLAGKRVNKARLQEELHLPMRPDVPLLAVISRLTSQKGFDLIAQILGELMQQDLQLVVLGTGEPYFEAMFTRAAGMHPDKLAVHMRFDETLAHRIYAGSDLFLMPSRFEPCGLAQLIALRYGTLPLVRETGGLKDTIVPFNEHTGAGNGFSFAPYNAYDMLYTIRQALIIYQNKEVWQQLVRQAMTADWSWSRSAAEYERLYQDVCRRNVATTTSKNDSN